MTYNIHFFFPHTAAQSLSFSCCSRIAGQPGCCRGAAIAVASSNREACRQASSRLAELLKFIPLCILQYPPFFLPLPKQQATRHLGYFKFVPPTTTKAPLPFPPSLLSHSHKHTGYFKRKWIHVFFASFTKVLDLLEENETDYRVLAVVLERTRRWFIDCHR